MIYNGIKYNCPCIIVVDDNFISLKIMKTTPEPEYECICSLASHSFVIICGGFCQQK